MAMEENKGNRQQQALWDEFLQVWPIARLASMKLEEYSKAGSKDSFTYWIESRLDSLGSIWGGSSFKFGVFSRKDTDRKESGSKLSYSNDYGWYSTLGHTAEQAFEKIRAGVVRIATLASRGDLDGIQALNDLGEATRWKIAFHYQNTLSPSIVNIFKLAPLALFADGLPSRNMATLQRAAMARRPPELGLLEFGHQIWSAWSLKNLEIYKLSHGDAAIPADTRQTLLEQKLAWVHSTTERQQVPAFRKAPVGALFFLCHSNSLQLVGQFTSPAKLRPGEDAWYERHYRVLQLATRHDRYTASRKMWSPMYNSTFGRVQATDLPHFERTLLKPYFDIDLAELAMLAGQDVEAPTEQPVPAAEAVMNEPEGISLNRIYYGPPGTGKTYALQRLLERDYEQPLQMLSLAQLQSQFIAEKIVGLTWWRAVAATLYDLGGEATVPQIVDHPFMRAMYAIKTRKAKPGELVWSTLLGHTIDESTTVNYEARFAPRIFDKSVDAQWRFAGQWPRINGELVALVAEYRALNGAPRADELIKRYRFVTFHQSFGYEEFVEGLRPVLQEEGEQQAEIRYEIRPGVFKQLCRDARLAPNERFAIVIDEINRGNISKIFGELITLIEADKRDPMDGNPPPVELTLPYSGEQFSVPANVDIIGTMNTADRSLALLDTALRRRFDFVALMPDTRAEKDIDDPDSAPLAGLQVVLDDTVIDVRLMLHRINERIEALYDRDHCIGHAYFTTLANAHDGQERFEALAHLFRNRIMPLLEEYFFEDWQKIRLVLGDNQKKGVAEFIAEVGGREEDLVTLFGEEHGLDQYGTRSRYVLQEAAFSNPAAYVGIYQMVQAVQA